MYFKNEKNKESFREGLRKVNKNDRDAVSTVYLLSADSCLWRRAKQATLGNRILLNNIRLRKLSEDGYVLLGAAKDMKYGTKYLTLGDLSDRSVITPKIYKLISQAIQIKRCGAEIMRNEKGE